MEKVCGHCDQLKPHIVEWLRVLYHDVLVSLVERPLPSQLASLLSSRLGSHARDVVIVQFVEMFDERVVARQRDDVLVRH